MLIWIPEGRAPNELKDISSLWPDGWEDDKQSLSVVISAEVPAVIQQAIASGCTFVAHNAEVFDSEAWARLVGGPQPTWYDTIHLCRAAGIPAGLDKAGQFICGRGKDEDGKDALRLLYTAKMRGANVWYAVGTVPLWTNLLRYNIADVLLLRRIYDWSLPYRREAELRIHSRVNARGCRVDLRFAQRLRVMWQEYQTQAKDAIEQDTLGEIDAEDTRSIPKVKAWLAKQGLVIPSLNRKEVEQLLNDPDGFFGDTEDEKACRVAAVLRNRMEASRAVVGKVERIFDVVDEDERVRNVLAYHAAHTGRFASRDIQLHNMPRGVAKLAVEKLCRADVTLEQVRAEFESIPAADRKGQTVGDALATLMRPVIVAEAGKLLLPLDYSAIEARCVVWLACDERALDVFRDPSQCIYCDMASSIYGRKITKANKDERGVGKICVLGCGYGMGATKFATYAALVGVDLPGVGLTGDGCVKTYRNTYPGIPALWKAYERAARRAIEYGESSYTNRCSFERANGALVITLPSGRQLWYRNARVALMRPKWNPSAPEQETMVYRTGHGYDKVIYGGLLTENISQATCRDLMVEAMPRLEMPIVLHVHDEIVGEEDVARSDAALQQAALAMSVGPEWAKGFPIRVEGHSCERYVKSPWSTSAEVDAMDGKILKFRGRK